MRFSAPAQMTEVTPPQLGGGSAERGPGCWITRQSGAGRRPGMCVWKLSWKYGRVGAGALNPARESGARWDHRGGGLGCWIR